MKRFTLLDLMIVAMLLCTVSATCYGADVKVEATDHAERVIYHSPETPGYSSWVGLWQLPNGALQCDFLQATGPKKTPTISTPVLESTDAGKTWTRQSETSFTGWSRLMAVLTDGTMVRPDARGWYFDEVGILQYPNNNFMGVCRSTDGGVTWGESINLVSPREYKMCIPILVRPLKDGRLVAFAGISTKGFEQLTKAMFISTDQGKSWSKPIVVMPLEVGACEESDFCELPNGNLFFVHRAVHHGSDPLQTRMQSIVRKQGKTFVPGKCERASLPHSGLPAVLYTKEGVILHLGTDGVSWTADLGKTWTRLNIPGTPYYPQALQLKDGTIIVVGHTGSDDRYGTVDQSIRQQTFRLHVNLCAQSG